MTIRRNCLSRELRQFIYPNLRNSLYYDVEGDFLELQRGPFTKSFCRDIAPGVYERVDEKTGQVTGIGVIGLRKGPGPIFDVTIPVKIELMPAGAPSLPETAKLSQPAVSRKAKK